MMTRHFLCAVLTAFFCVSVELGAPRHNNGEMLK